MRCRVKPALWFSRSRHSSLVSQPRLKNLTTSLELQARFGAEG